MSMGQDNFQRQFLIQGELISVRREPEMEQIVSQLAAGRLQRAL